MTGEYYPRGILPNQKQQLSAFQKEKKCRCVRVRCCNMASSNTGGGRRKVINGTTMDIKKRSLKPFGRDGALLCAAAV